MTSPPPNSREALLAHGSEDHYIDPELYDFEYKDRTSDTYWYVNIANTHAHEGGRLLELGAGTGRITCPIAKAGHQVIALDRKSTMTARLEQRLAGLGLRQRVELVHSQLPDIRVPDASACVVIAPFNVLMHLYTWQDLLRCFREVFRVLTPHGIFALDVLLPDLEWLKWDPDARHAATPFIHPSTGQRLIYTTNHTYDPITQVCHVRIFYDEAPPKGQAFVPPKQPVRLVHLAHRQIFPEELRMLLSVAGFELLAHTGDFTDAPLAEGHESQTILCRKL